MAEPYIYYNDEPLSPSQAVSRIFRLEQENANLRRNVEVVTKLYKELQAERDLLLAGSKKE